MFRMLYPNEECSSSYKIKYHELIAAGYKGIIFDIDNTLVPHGADADERAVRLFETLREIGFATCLLSNNREERVLRFNREIGSLYLYKADKPSVRGYREAMKRMGTKRKTTVFIGDQLFTDVAAGNLAGVRTILVRPQSEKDLWYTLIFRKIERAVYGERTYEGEWSTTNV